MADITPTLQLNTNNTSPPPFKSPFSRRSSHKHHQHSTQISSQNSTQHSSSSSSPPSRQSKHHHRASSSSSRIVKLNIGGRKFVTTEGTLLLGTDASSCPLSPRVNLSSSTTSSKVSQEGSSSSSFFTVLLSGKFSPLVDEEGCIFIDRDGAFFEPILTYLRTGQFSVPPGMSIDDIYREVDFYGITPLMELISARRAGELVVPSSSRKPVVKSIKAMYSMSNVIAVVHQDFTVSAWKYQGLAEGWVPIMLCCSCVRAIDAITMGESKNSIEQIANIFMCAYSKEGFVQIWDRLHDPTFKTWDPFDLDMSIDHIKFLVNTWFLVALSSDGTVCKIVDLRGKVTVEPVSLGIESNITCIAEADPFLFFGCSNGSIGELKQDMFTGVWVVTQVFSDPECQSITCMHCAAIADSQSTKIYLCYGSELGTVRLCSKMVHLDDPFTVLSSVTGHYAEPIKQVMTTEYAEIGLLYSSLSISGYARLFRYLLFIDNTRAWTYSYEQQAKQPQALSSPSDEGAHHPQKLLKSTARNRCVCSLGSTTSDGSSIGPISELIKFERTKVGALQRNQGQLLVASQANHGLSFYDVSSFCTENTNVSSTTGTGITLHPVGIAATTACCVMHSSRPAQVLVLLTGHADGVVQAWDLSLALDNKTFSRTQTHSTSAGIGLPSSTQSLVTQRQAPVAPSVPAQ